MRTHPIFDHVEIGLGTWSWGDRLVWSYGNGYSDQDIEEVFSLAIASGIRFFDTAEVYGRGKSEQFLGKLLKTTSEKTVIATKFMPFPWRLSRKSFTRALRASLDRLELPAVALYQIHWPMPPVSIPTWMECMLEAHQQGLIEAVGVSNYDLRQTLVASDFLTKEGLPLASTQMEYHLLERRIEKNGLMKECADRGIKIIAYSPLAMGILTGKYSSENPPSGVRASQYNREFLGRIQPLILMMKKLGMNHDGKTASQVALNWAMGKGVIPIPGAKNAHQLEMNVGALGWHLTEDEMSMLDEMSDTVCKRGV
ncbi:MAG: aldo/keto reductase [Anaerolineaceae bacterium]|nr:aldo/keto reductase [Anaerolineaceae bacterium]